MATHRKITLNLSDSVMRHLRAEARRQGRTTSDLVETALCLYLRRPRRTASLRPLPTFSGGPLLVDVADRGALHRALGDR